MRLKKRISHLTILALLVSLVLLSSLDGHPFVAVVEAQMVNGQPDAADGIDASFFVRIDTPGTSRYVMGEEIPFVAVVTGNANVDSISFVWDMDDGTTLTGREITHTYDADGSYTIVVHARLGSESATGLKQIAVVPPPTPPLPCVAPTGAPTILYDKFPNYGSTTTFDFVTEPVDASVEIEWDFGTGFPGDTATGRSVAFDFSQAVDASDRLIDKRWNIGKNNGCGQENGRQCTFWVVATVKPIARCEGRFTVPNPDYGMPVYVGDQSISGLEIKPLMLTKSVVLTAVVESGTNVDFYWEYGNTKLPKDKGEFVGSPPQVKSTFPDDLVAKRGGGRVEVRVRAVNSAGSAIKSIVVDLPSNLTIPNDSPKRSNEPITFSVVGLPKDETFTYFWNPGIDDAETEKTDGPEFAHTYGKDGKYLLILRAVSASSTVYGGSIAYAGVSAPPNTATIKFKGDVTVPTLDEELYLCVTALDTGATYIWDFGDGLVVSDPIPNEPGCAKHRYTESATGQRSYILNLKVRVGNDVIKESDIPLIMEAADVPGSNNPNPVLPYNIMLPMVNKGYINIASRIAGGQQPVRQSQPVTVVPAATPTPVAQQASPETTAADTPTPEPADQSGDDESSDEGTPAPEPTVAPTVTPIPEPTVEPTPHQNTADEDPTTSEPAGTIPLPAGTIPQPAGTIPLP